MKKEQYIDILSQIHHAIFTKEYSLKSFGFNSIFEYLELLNQMVKHDFAPSSINVVDLLTKKYENPFDTDYSTILDIQREPLDSNRYMTALMDLIDAVQNKHFSISSLSLTFLDSKEAYSAFKEQEDVEDFMWNLNYFRDLESLHIDFSASLDFNLLKKLAQSIEWDFTWLKHIKIDLPMHLPVSLEPSQANEYLYHLLLKLEESLHIESINISNGEIPKEVKDQFLQKDRQEGYYWKIDDRDDSTYIRVRYDECEYRPSSYEEEESKEEEL